MFKFSLKIVLLIKFKSKTTNILIKLFAINSYFKTIKHSFIKKSNQWTNPKMKHRIYQRQFLVNNVIRGLKIPLRSSYCKVVSHSNQTKSSWTSLFIHCTCKIKVPLTVNHPNQSRFNNIALQPLSECTGPLSFTLYKLISESTL